MRFIGNVINWLSSNHRIGLDLGSSFIRISLPDQKKIVTQPAVVAKNIRSDQIVAIGDEAEKVVGRTPRHIQTINPVVSGMVDDSQALEALLSMLLHQHGSGLARFIGWDVLVALPAEVTDVSVRIIANALERVGARKVLAVPTSLAALIGVGAPVGDPTTQIVVSAGAGITQAAAVSSGGVITESSSKLAGNQFDQKIIDYVADEFGIRISQQQARRIKHSLAAVRGWSDEPGESVTVNGQDEASFLPREITVSRIDITEAIEPLIEELTKFIEDFIASLSADMVADIASHGLHLVGGVAQLPGLSDHIADTLDITVHTRVNPSQTVIEGVNYIASQESRPRFAQSIHVYESTQ